MKKNLLFLALGWLMATLACSSATTPPTSAAKVTAAPPATAITTKPATPVPSTPAVKVVNDTLVSDKKRAAAKAPVEDVSELAAGNTAFAVALYQAERQPNGNLIFSPYSISQALGMTYAGARGNTEKQMVKALRFTLPQNRLHPAFNTLDLALMRPPEKTGAEDQPFQLSIANSIWGQKDFPFLPAFIDGLAENYGAGLRVTDFINAPEPARQAINNWVSQQTKDKIKDLIPQGAIDSNTRLVLANAVYFKAAWQFQFEKSLTKNGNFKLADGQTVSVPMMTSGTPMHLRYAQGAGYQAVELPYQGNKTSMLIIMPERFADFEAALTAEQLATLNTELTPKSVALTMPKFSYETSLGLADTLAGMGMPDAFSPTAANFSGMDGVHDLFITAIIHKAFIAVDEVGTEAAAATAVIVGIDAMPQTDMELTIDHPFIYLIRDNESGTVLFMGRVSNPAN